MKKISWVFIILAMSLIGLTAVFADSSNGMDPEGKMMWSFSYFGRDDFFYRPSDMEYDAANSLIYIADYGNNRVVVFDGEGRYVRIIGNKGQGPGEFAGPTGVCVMKDSRLAVADYGNNRIQILDAGGEFERMINTRELRVADLLVIGKEIYTVPSYGQSGYHLNMGLKEDSQPLVNVLDFEGNVARSLTTDAYPETQPFIRAIKHRVSMALASDGRLFLPFLAINMVYVFDPAGNKVDEFERPIPFKPLFPQLLQQRSSEGMIQMSAKTDMVSRSARFGNDGLLYILTHMESYDKMRKALKDPEDPILAPMQVDVLDPKSYKIVRSIDVDAAIRTFALLGEDRLAYIYEDAEGELVFKCVTINQ
jgi:hypothetical protein